MLVYLMCGKDHDEMFLFLMSEEDGFLIRAYFKFKLGLKRKNIERSTRLALLANYKFEDTSIQISPVV